MAVKFKEKCRNSIETLSSLQPSNSPPVTGAKEYHKKLDTLTTVSLSDIIKLPADKVLQRKIPKIKSSNSSSQDKYDSDESNQHSSQQDVKQNFANLSDNDTNDKNVTESVLDYVQRTENYLRKIKKAIGFSEIEQEDTKVKIETIEPFDENTSETINEEFECVEYLENDKEVTYIAILQNENDTETMDFDDNELDEKVILDPISIDAEVSTYI